MEDQKITIDKCKFKIRFLINLVENTKKILQKFIPLLRAEKSLLQTLISETEYEGFLSKCFESEESEPEIIQKADQIIKDFSKKEL